MITLLILYYINIVWKGKEKISFPHLLQVLICTWTGWVN
nr:MAG TPA: hypothetical protein [Inoviridae sp.]